MVLRINDKEYKLKASTNAICILEELFGDINNINFDKPNYSATRGILYALLNDNHNIPLKRVGDLIDEYTLIPENNLSTLLKILSEEICTWSNARFGESENIEESKKK